MRLLLFGAKGQVGWELQRSLAPLGELLALGREGPVPTASVPTALASACGDLADADGVARTVRQWRPQVVVNAAAYTAVDKAEAEPERAHRLNALAPQALAQAAADVGAWLVHYSTDYVFDGSGEQPWAEDAPTAPLNAYGRSKLAGEDAVRAHAPQHLLLRTCWVHGTRGGNFARTILRLARERQQLQVIDDQWGAPTGADLIADVTAHAIRQALRQGPALAGTYHLCAAGSTTWHGYARYLIDTARQLQPQGPWAVESINAVPSSAFATAAARPHNSRLNTSRLQHAFGLHLPPWQQGVERRLREWLTPS